MGARLVHDGVAHVLEGEVLVHEALAVLVHAQEGEHGAVRAVARLGAGGVVHEDMGPVVLGGTRGKSHEDAVARVGDRRVDPGVHRQIARADALGEHIPVELVAARGEHDALCGLDLDDAVGALRVDARHLPVLDGQLYRRRVVADIGALALGNAEERLHERGDALLDAHARAPGGNAAELGVTRFGREGAAGIADGVHGPVQRLARALAPTLPDGAVAAEVGGREAVVHKIAGVQHDIRLRMGPVAEGRDLRAAGGEGRSLLQKHH